MRRTDMDRNTLYAINATGVPKPGYVLDPGKVPSKVKVRVYWQWENQDEDYLNPQPSFTGNRNDERHVNTSDVLKPWSEYCMDLRVARAARLAEADAAKQAEKTPWTNWTLASTPWVSCSMPRAVRDRPTSTSRTCTTWPAPAASTTTDTQLCTCCVWSRPSWPTTTSPSVL